MTADEHRDLGSRALSVAEELALQCLQALEVADEALKAADTGGLPDYHRARVRCHLETERFMKLKKRYDAW